MLTEKKIKLLTEMFLEGHYPKGHEDRGYALLVVVQFLLFLKNQKYGLTQKK